MFLILPELLLVNLMSFLGTFAFDGLFVSEKRFSFSVIGYSRKNPNMKG